MQKIAVVKRNEVRSFKEVWEVLPPASTLKEASSVSVAEVIKWAAWQVATRLGVIKKATIPSATEFYETVVIDFEDIAKSIHEHVYDVYRNSGKPPKLLIIGGAAYRKLHRQCTVEYPFDFDFPRNVFCGLKIIIVPWMDGFVALTDLDELS